MAYSPRRRKVYLAARFSRQSEVRKIRDQLHALGYEVLAAWLDEDLRTESKLDREAANRIARGIYDEIMRASVFVCFIDNHVGSIRGGHQVEFGFALAKGKVVISVGHVERNIFHQDWRVRQFGTTEDFLEAARSWTNFIPPQSSSELAPASS